MGKKSRKHYLILPSYQIKLVAFMILVVFFGSLLHGFFLYHITSKNIQSGFLSAHNRLRSTWEILKPAIIVTNSISFLLISIFLLIITIFISHRIIGPVFKVGKHLKKISEGKLNLPALRLREGDEGQFLCDMVNELQDNFRSRFVILQKMEEELKNSEELNREEVAEKIKKVLDGIELDNSKK